MTQVLSFPPWKAIEQDSMSAKLRKYNPHLRTLAVSKPALCKAIIQNAEPDLIKCLCECAMNILKGNVSITPGQKRKLAHHKTHLRNLVKRQVSLSKKKKVLQKGGFLPALLAPILGTVLPALGSGIGNLIRAVKKK